MTAQLSTGRDANAAYHKRMLYALIFSVILHFALLLPHWLPEREAGPDLAKDPIVLNLVPEQVPQPQQRRLVDSMAESEQPEQPVDLISDRNSAASDTSDGAEEGAMPNVDEGGFEQLGAIAPPPTPMPAPAPQPASNENQTEDAPEETEPRDAPDVEEAPDAREAVQVAAATPETMQAPPQEAAPQAPSQTPSEPSRQPAPVERPARTQSPVTGEAQNLGFLGFEAMRDEIAPYLQQVRNAVEKRWKIEIQLKYHGTDPTKAVLDCAIRPDGTLASVAIVEHGGSVSYAALCKEAIEKAGPFPPFPFDVPEIYKNENLRIRWTFSYL